MIPSHIYHQYQKIAEYQAPEMPNNDFPEPKDWDNISDNEMQRISECVTRTNDWVTGILLPSTRDQLLLIEDANQVCSDFEAARMRKLNNSYTHRFSNGISMIVDSSVATIFKANKVMTQVFLDMKDWCELCLTPKKIMITVISAGLFAVGLLCTFNRK